jgi:hypothetical protein
MCFGVGILIATKKMYDKMLVTSRTISDRLGEYILEPNF